MSEEDDNVGEAVTHQEHYPRQQEMQQHEEQEQIAEVEPTMAQVTPTTAPVAPMPVHHTPYIPGASPGAAALDQHAATLMYQQQQAQRIARQILNTPAVVSHQQQNGVTPVRPHPLASHVPQMNGVVSVGNTTPSSPQQQPHFAPSTPHPLTTYGTYATTPMQQQQQQQQQQHPRQEPFYLSQRIEGTNMPPLQGALPQELPASLAGDVMRADAGQGQQQQQQQQPADAFLQAMGAPIPIMPGSESVPVTNDERVEHKDNDMTKRTTRSSRFRGVTKHRRSGRWEAHIWVKASGKQVYLGGYEIEEHAAEAYDVAAIKCKGPKVKTNFPLEKYTELMQFMDTISLEELVMAVRRQSQGFARGSSAFRGVTHHPNGRWEARIGMPGSKHIYLGLYVEEQVAAQAYDRALVKLRGPNAATNFAISEYKDELKQYYARKNREEQTGVVEDINTILKTDPKKKNGGGSRAAADKKLGVQAATNANAAGMNGHATPPGGNQSTFIANLPSFVSN